MPRPLDRQIVVITGASSGIGRATARLLASRGAAVVLAARDDAALQDAAREVEEVGARALAVQTDVSDPAQVQRLAEQAVTQFGRIDTWVNDAAVSTYGTVVQLTFEEMRRVIEVDLLGMMYGAKVALPYLRASGGTVINISSVTGKRAVPLQAPYSAAKHGIVGFADALRAELDYENAGVAVTTILPYGIDTPFFYHAWSKLGVLPRPTPPVYAPEDVARAIARAAEHPTREIIVGAAAKATILTQRVSPTLLDWVMGRTGMGVKMQVTDRPDDGADNLFAPMPSETHAVHGGFNALGMPANGQSQTTQFTPPWQQVAIAGSMIALAALARRAQRNQQSPALQSQV
jgi:short-subunit dehydrogenase